MSEPYTPEMPFIPEELLTIFPDAIVVHDMNNQLLYWNSAAEKLYGWPGEELLGRPVDRILYPDLEEWQAALEVLRDTGEWSGELRQIDREGHEHVVDVRQLLRSDAEGQAVEIVSFNRDVTLRKKQEDVVARAHHVQSSSILAGGIAHELNNALAPIMLSSTMLKRMVKEEKSKNMVAMIEKCATKGANLINELLAFERGKGGGSEVIGKTQLVLAFQRSNEALVPDSVEFSIACEDDLWNFRGDSVELGKAYQHIIKNAVEAMPDGGSLNVEVTNCRCDENFASLAPEVKVGAYVRIAFRDSGFGIDEEILGRVAEPFFTTKSARQGHGFGLSDTQAIVKGHKGFMVLESDKGRGTTLTLFLPADVDRYEDTITDTEKIVTLSDSLEGTGKLVLVADDKIFIRETIQRTLEERGYSVLTAQDGTEALALYAANQKEVDLVVTNVEMPFMDGPALCRALRKFDPEVRILISSGHTQRQKVAEIQSCGVDEFLAKPYTAQQLVDRVRSIIEG